MAAQHAVQDVGREAAGGKTRRLGRGIRARPGRGFL
jgi:hypothetical protein